MTITTAVLSPDWDEPRAGAPVALLLHGYGSHEADLAGLAPWLPQGLRWASVRAPLPHPAMGFAWFPLQLPDEPAHADIEQATSRLWDWIDESVDDDAPLVPIGFSQGGLMALQMLRTRPERVAAAVVLSGLIAATPQPGDVRLAAERPPVLWSHGDRDDVIPAQAVAQLGDFLPGHSRLTHRTYPGLGHGVDERVMADVRDFLASHVH